MKITLNGTRHETGADSLAALLDEMGYGDVKVATAVNEEFVPAANRADHRLADGDRIEIVTPRQGG
ncbi:sulfur carrier protein ThiS [Roseovarius tibetensis]|uniref:sulfur carrier protein ThiS n=1 Tax=Roseovarius tibetensis TaxID=2685897 RepID=UPI003D7FC4BE